MGRVDEIAAALRAAGEAVRAGAFAPEDDAWLRSVAADIDEAERAAVARTDEVGRKVARAAILMAIKRVEVLALVRAGRADERAAKDLFMTAAKLALKALVPIL